jgi:hypothetical protein
MVDDVWKYGADDASIARVIREGAESEGMPPWKGMLSESEIRAMVVFIREKGEQARQRAAKVPKPLDDQPVRSREHTFRLRSVAENLATPWSLAFLPDGRMLVTELPGHLRFIEGGKVSAPVAGTPRVRAQGQGGLMEVALHPGYATNGWVYLSFAEAGANDQTRDGGMTVVVRGRIRDHRWVEEQTIFRAPLWSYRPAGFISARDLCSTTPGICSFPSASGVTCRMRRTSAGPTGKCIGSLTTDEFRRTTRLWACPTRWLRSGVTDIAIPKVWRGTR